MGNNNWNEREVFWRIVESVNDSELDLLLNSLKIFEDILEEEKSLRSDAIAELQEIQTVDIQNSISDLERKFVGELICYKGFIEGIELYNKTNTFEEYSEGTSKPECLENLAVQNPDCFQTRRPSSRTVEICVIDVAKTREKFKIT